MTESPCRSLAEYVTALVDAVDAADPGAGAALRQIAGSRRGRIGLDDEEVVARFDPGGRLTLEDAVGRVDGRELVDGAGRTDRATVLDLLAGRLEVADAILDGRLDVTGALEEVSRMFELIEVLLDAAVHVPALQRLARDFVADPCREQAAASGTAVAPPVTAPPPPDTIPAWPAAPDPAELALLERLDLLPSGIDRGAATPSP